MFRFLSQGTFSRVFSIVISIFIGAVSAHAGSYKVLYGFGGSNATPSSGLVFDAQGNAYGVTSAGGYNEAGTVYELSPTTGYHLLFKFGKSQAGGAYPVGNLALDAAGNLYGATLAGGIERNCCGIVFELSPPSDGGFWTETILHTFCLGTRRCADGDGPAGGLITDAAGNLYGTTQGGGAEKGSGAGTVFELSPSSGGWTETVLYSFGNNPADGHGVPEAGLIFDSAGNLYGTTSRGGTLFAGDVFELSPSNGGWTETLLYEFGAVNDDGFEPLAGVTFDAAGNLYGTTDEGGRPSCGRGSGCGIVFELTPTLNGGWTETIIHSFAGSGEDGEFPQAPVVLDTAGNVYGTTLSGGVPGCAPLTGCGTAFRLTPEAGGSWTGTLLRFPGGSSGSNPMAPLTLDLSGNIYGTTTAEGPLGGGVAFKITQ